MQENSFIDFNNSTAKWLTIDNSIGKFMLESCISVKINETTEDYYFLGSSVLACKVYELENIFWDPPYMFSAIFSKNEVLRKRLYIDKGNVYYDKSFDLNTFKSISLNINFKQYKQIKSKAELVNESTKNSLLYGRIKKKQDLIEIKSFFPIKHINLKEKLFQVETGPVLYIDKIGKDISNSIQMAYIAFNLYNKCNVFYKNSYSKNIRLSEEVDIQIYKGC